MSVVRSFLNGVGTGAGVAWPLFGILASTFCLGPAAAFPLGVACAVLFCLTTSFIFYQSYTQKIEENRQLNEQIVIQAHQFIRNLHQLFVRPHPTQTNIELVDYLMTCPLFDNPAFAMPHEFMTFILDKNVEFIRHYNSITGAKKKELLNQLLLSFSQAQSSNPFTYRETFNLAFPAFVGAFGSIAGCGAGVSGLLVSLGVFSGFGALPIAGIILLFFATTMGLYRANEAVEEKIAGDTNTKIYHSLKQLNGELLEALPLENIRVNAQDEIFAEHVTLTPVHHLNGGLLQASTLENIGANAQDEVFAEHDILIPVHSLRHRSRKLAYRSQSRGTLFHHQETTTEELDDTSSLQNSWV